MDTLRYWLKGVRFYIALSTGLITGLTIWWAQTAYGGSQLATIRTQEVFAWLATGLIALAVSIGPTYKLFPKLGGKQLLFDARRLIGVSAAWFATLHVGIAYLSQFKAVNPLSLPSNYKLAFTLGILALVGLLAMAFTSFNAAMRAMGIWWFRLHRLIYLVVVLVLFHIYMIGVHAAELVVIVLLSALSILIMGLYVGISIRFRKVTKWQLISLTTMAILLLLAGIYGFHQRQTYLSHETSQVEAGSS